jgi:hypothetical protein
VEDLNRRGAFAWAVVVTPDLSRCKISLLIAPGCEPQDKQERKVMQKSRQADT